MKKINISFNKSLLKQWDKWISSIALKKAMDFPFIFMRRMAGEEDTENNEFKDYFDNLLPHEKERVGDLFLETYRNSNRMAVFLSEWNGLIFFNMKLYQPYKKKPSLELRMMFYKNGRVRSGWECPPLI